MSIHDDVDKLSDILGLPRIKFPEPLDVHVRMPTQLSDGEITPATSPENQLAREAVAQIEREEGWTACAENRLRGAYDGDTEHRIALAAIRLARK